MLEAARTSSDASTRAPKRRACLALLALALTSLAPGRTLALGTAEASLPTPAQPAEEPLSPHRVLFVGNSLTATHDVPGLLAALARASGHPIEVGAVVRGGWGLEDHWTDGTARRQIRDGHWDVVILQQGPSSLDESRTELIRWTQALARDIRAAGAVPALYAVWPEASRRAAFPAVSASYRAAAEAVGGVFLPVGDAWLASWALRPEAGLYGPDAFHPSPLGAYVAALTIHTALFDTPPEGLPAPPATAEGEIPDDLVRDVQRAVAQAVGRTTATAGRP